jgi:hypothetical protein
MRNVRSPFTPRRPRRGRHPGDHPSRIQANGRRRNGTGLRREPSPATTTSMPEQAQRAIATDDAIERASQAVRAIAGADETGPAERDRLVTAWAEQILARSQTACAVEMPRIKPNAPASPISSTFRVLSTIGGLGVATLAGGHALGGEVIAMGRFISSSRRCACVLGSRRSS